MSSDANEKASKLAAAEQSDALGEKCEKEVAQLEKLLQQESEELWATMNDEKQRQMDRMHLKLARRRREMKAVRDRGSLTKRPYSARRRRK